MTLEERYRDVVRRVGGRARLIAVSKGATEAQVAALYALGQRDFGENRADQLALRAAKLPPDARWHFIGNIQSNKVRVLRDLKPLVHSFDRPDLLSKWGATPVLIQVNFSEGAAAHERRGSIDRRNGVPPQEVGALLDALRAAAVECRGLSTLPPKDGDPRAVFRALRQLRDEHKLAELSMGMSDDHETAIEEGATMVRVGRAIFG